MSGVKYRGSTPGLRLKLPNLSIGGDSRISGVAVKCVDIRRNTNGKAAIWTNTDTEARKRGERKGLDTPVVHALNVAH